jgi:hypothetical protein
LAVRNHVADIRVEVRDDTGDSGDTGRQAESGEAPDTWNGAVAASQSKGSATTCYSGLPRPSVARRYCGSGVATGSLTSSLNVSTRLAVLGGRSDGSSYESRLWPCLRSGMKPSAG